MHEHVAATPSLLETRQTFYPLLIHDFLARSSVFNSGGSTGEDFNRNLYIPTIDFGTIHVYVRDSAIDDELRMTNEKPIQLLLL